MTTADGLEPALVHHIVNIPGWRDLRPLRKAAVTPLTVGHDALLPAPTAGGKTETTCFPLLSRMHAQGWSGTSVLHVCPLKAMLNNLPPRVETYTAWRGRTTALWHGDTPAGARRRILASRPDALLTTPELLEAMLVSVNVDHTSFSGLRAVVVDEVHAFAGDDRGWHLLAVLERLQRVVGRSVQRVGPSAIVGNPGALLTWLQGPGAGRRPGRVVASHLSGARPTPAPVPPGDVQLDYVGSLDNAATVVGALHRGGKRPVFCESRRLVEELGLSPRLAEATLSTRLADLTAATVVLTEPVRFVAARK
ncbi:DEAD/DEAH box helicase [Streptomyces somaliensis DSM 40738]|uniref:DEAD/DEAH box helicase n=1 Tax=Streptomyces somaliensis (strain ATCC 33201 / DSM 40738 / JCM 12659 / KCTC 9044 / NCTC 11332 / NRRL B-12077 / IP 733) TaxID=1134445 RepID=A0AA44D9W9_STRE0|nr:DEAD/DEAH box helicase [Streptomyces somaliensis DSM 40738]